MVSTKISNIKSGLKINPPQHLTKNLFFSKLFIFYFTNHDTNISHNSTNFQLYVQYSNYNFLNSNFHLRKYHPAYPHSL